MGELKYSGSWLCLIFFLWDKEVEATKAVFGMLKPEA